MVRPYSQREALGQFWLKTLDSGKYFNEDYLAHLELQGKDMMVMLTYNGVMLVRTKRHLQSRHLRTQRPRTWHLQTRLPILQMHLLQNLPA